MRKEAKKIIEFKGDKKGLTLLISENYSFEAFKEELGKKVKEGGKFFNGAKVRLDLAGRQGRSEEIEEIKKVLLSYNLIFDGIIPFTIDSRPEINNEAHLDFKERQETAALLVHRTLRSGQKVSYKGAVVVLGDVNPGAEIIAGGDIIVFGRLRGVAHAGVEGASSASITALRLEPAQLRIGEVISRAPDSKEETSSAPEQARLQQDKIVILPFGNKS